MNTRTLLNLILALAVVVLATLTVLEPGKAPPAPANPTVTPLKAAAVNTIRIERPDEPPVVLERQGEQWRMTAPRALPAYGVRAAMMSAAAEAESMSRVDQPCDLTKFDLDPPRATLTLNDTALRFGDIDPLHQRRYLLVGDQIHLVSDAVYPLISRGWEHFVDPALLTGEARIEAVALPDGTTLSHGEPGWTVTPPQEGLSADAPTLLHDAWRFGRALDVSAYSGDEPEHQAVTLTLEGGNTLRFLILARDPELLLARPDLGLVYRMADDGRALLSLKPAGEGEG